MLWSRINFSHSASSLLFCILQSVMWLREAVLTELHLEVLHRLNLEGEIFNSYFLFGKYMWLRSTGSEKQQECLQVKYPWNPEVRSINQSSFWVLGEIRVILFKCWVQPLDYKTEWIWKLHIWFFKPVSEM